MVLFQGYSCVEFLNAGMRNSGISYLQIRGTTYWFLKVYCEQEIADGGWTVSMKINICYFPRLKYYDSIHKIYKEKSRAILGTIQRYFKNYSNFYRCLDK